MKHGFRRRDLLWILAYPLYQLIGTFRHEGSHALAAVLQGAAIRQFVFWPTWTGSGVRWGYVSWSGPANWVALAAPYLCDLSTFVLFYVICTRLRIRRHWVWVNLVAIGLISPLVDSGYNYLNGLSGGGDVAKLLHLLSATAVHGYFAATLVGYALGLFLTLRPVPGQATSPASEEGAPRPL
jgi:hypothetical protein